MEISKYKNFILQDQLTKHIGTIKYVKIMALGKLVDDENISMDDFYERIQMVISKERF